MLLYNFFVLFKRIKEMLAITIVITMKTLKLHVMDRNYSAWEVFETTDLKKVVIDFKPLDHKLFSNDSFTFDDNKVELVHSTVKSGTPMPGVLIVSGNKTYGRKNGRLLYKCIPDDIRLPSFLIPYEVKHVGFSKVLINMYVTFSYRDWDDKHPHGYLNNAIGPVDVLDNFYEYQLYCKSLNTSILICSMFSDSKIAFVSFLVTYLFSLFLTKFLISL